MKKRGLCRLVLAAAVLTAMLPGEALADPPRPARPRPLAATYAEDSFEAGNGDDKPVYATDVTGAFAPLGADPAVRNHSISEAPATGSEYCDEDWFKFQVTPADYAAKTSYLIEADWRGGIDNRALLVIEVYGPELGTVHPSTPPGVELHDFQVPGSGCIAPDLHLGLGDVWHDDGGVGSVSFSPPSAGWYYFRVRPWRNPADTPLPGYGDFAGTYGLRLKKGFASRAWGTDRWETAVRFSRELYPDGVLTAGGSDAFGDAVVVASGMNYPDALAGSALAGAINAPLLLVNPASVPPIVKSEINRLRPQRIFILGGETAVSPAVFTALSALPAGAPVTPVRIAGPGRAETAARIAQKLYDDGGGDPIRGAFLVNGWSFPDALSASPMAALNNMPVLLTHTGSLDAVTRNAILAYGIEDVVIVGGPLAVSTAVESEVATLLGGAAHVRRVQGVDRYHTSREFAAWAGGLRDAVGTPESGYRVGTVAAPELMQALNPTTIGIASGSNFPDALSGGVWCGHAFSPLLLTPPASLSPYIYSTSSHVTPTGGEDYWADVVNSGYMTGIERSYVFGGPNAVNAATLLSFDKVTGAGGF